MSILFQAYPLARTALFSMDPEDAHEATLHSLRRAYDCSFTRGLMRDAALFPTKLMGLSLRNPVGLAAGLDKNGEHIDALGNLGFGLIEVGTVTPRAQPGNPRPRMFRLPKAQALKPLPQRQSHTHQALKATTFWVCSPRPSMPRCITSPRFKNTGAGLPSFLTPMPTPGGVPVVMMSPGSSVMN